MMTQILWWTMIKILALIDPEYDQCSWYRGAGPLNHLVRESKVHVEFRRQVSPVEWNLFTRVDIFFILRPHTQVHYEAMLTAKALGRPVWADFDDDFLAPEECSWFRDVKMNPEWVKKCLTVADHLTVSTEALKASYGRIYDGPITLIPNGFDFHSFRGLEQSAPRTKTIGWRGSETHDEDWAEVAPRYIQKVNEAGWETHFYWGNPKHVSFYVPHRHFRFPIASFHHALAEGHHSILVAPLRDTRFNRGKSNAAWIEGTMAGAMVLGRDLPEWHGKPNCVTYDTPDSFYSRLSDMMAVNTKDHRRVVREGQDYIHTFLDLKHLNHARMTVISELTKLL